MVKGVECVTAKLERDRLAELAARTRCEFPKLSDSSEAFSDDPTAIAKLSAAEILAAAAQDFTDEPMVPPPSPSGWRAWRHDTVLLIAFALVALLGVLAIHD